jgi:hypothetical protein
MLRLDIAQVPRLKSLRHIAGKKQQADRLAVQAGPDAHALS